MAFLGIYRAIYDYVPQDASELSLSEGDTLFILSKPADEPWWNAKKKAPSDEEDEPEGLVPNNYIEAAEPSHLARALYDYAAQTDEEINLSEEQRVWVFDETDPDWALVGSQDRKVFGFAPAIYIEAASSSGGGVNGASSSVAAAPVSAVPALPARNSIADPDAPLPGEADYVPPSGNSPAAALAGILAQKTGHNDSASSTRGIASSPQAASRAQYTPEGSEEEAEEEEAPPPTPPRPQSQISTSERPKSQGFMSALRNRGNSTSARNVEGSTLMSSPPQSPNSPSQTPRHDFHLYNIHEMIKYNNKSKKLPMTLGINVQRGLIMIAPEKSRDGPSQEWTAEKVMHYSIEGKHVFLELVRPSKSVDFHAGAKDTAQEIVAHLGELAGAAKAEGLREVLAASQGTGSDGVKSSRMLYEFLAQGDDEVTVAVGDEVHILDDLQSEEWWKVKRLKNGKEGVVPSSYVEVTGVVEGTTSRGMSGMSIVEQNRMEEERLTKEAAKRSKGKSDDIPERASSLTPDVSGGRRSKRNSASAPSNARGRPNQSRIRTWTDRSGTFKVEAEFIGLRDGKIHLHKLNGVKIAVPVAKMAVEDLEYVEQATGASLDEDKPLSDVKRRNTQRGKSGSTAVRGGEENGGFAGASVDRDRQVKDEDFWFDFFLSCGVDHHIVGRYVNAFQRDQITVEVLPEVTEGLLRTLGLKEGDILRVMKGIDAKTGRQRTGAGDDASGANGDSGGLFSGPGGALRNNTKKSRPAPAVQTNDIVSEDAFRSKGSSASPEPTAARTTGPANVSARDTGTGFDDNAWDVKPSRTPDIPTTRAAEAPRAAAQPLINDDIASLSITSPALIPTPTAVPASFTNAPAPSAQFQDTGANQQFSSQSSQPQGADRAIFDKIAALAPARQRPQPPPAIGQQPTNQSLLPPPPRASSAPGFPPQQANGFGQLPLQPQLTGFASPQDTGYAQQQQQQQGQLQPQQTAFQYGNYPNQQPQQPNGITNGGVYPQQTGLQAIQSNYPPLAPQPTGMSFAPQSQFGQQAQSQAYGTLPLQATGMPPQQTGLGSSPFADPPRMPYQPGAPSGLANSFTAQQTGFPGAQQGGYGIAQPTGMGMGGVMNGYPPQPQQAPGGLQLPPQATGGVLGPAQPLVAQKTGPAPPVRFGTGGGRGLVPQPTGRADLSKATPQNPFGF